MIALTDRNIADAAAGVAKREKAFRLRRHYGLTDEQWRLNREYVTGREQVPAHPNPPQAGEGGYEPGERIAAGMHRRRTLLALCILGAAATIGGASLLWWLLGRAL